MVCEAFNNTPSHYTNTILVLEIPHAQKHCNIMIHILTFLCILPCSSLCLELL